MKTPVILVPLAKGFEDIEAITIIDVMRRAGYEVVAAGLTTAPILASRQTLHVPGDILENVLDREYDMIALPGGRPGADNLAAHAGLIQRLIRQSKEDKWIAAVCAAPLVLDRAGLLEGKRFVIHPGAAAELHSGYPSAGRVVVDGKLITGIGAGAAMEFSLEIVRQLSGEAKVIELNAGLLYEGPWLSTLGI